MLRCSGVASSARGRLERRRQRGDDAMKKAVFQATSPERGGSVMVWGLALIRCNGAMAQRDANAV
eukprot:1325823-Prymnesium_polylepis.1